VWLPTTTIGLFFFGRLDQECYMRKNLGNLTPRVRGIELLLQFFYRLLKLGDSAGLV